MIGIGNITVKDAVNEVYGSSASDAGKSVQGCLGEAFIIGAEWNPIYEGARDRLGSLQGLIARPFWNAPRLSSGKITYTNITQTSFTMSWVPCDNFVESVTYTIKKTNPTTSTYVTGLTALTYNVTTGVAAGQSYFFTVFAVDANGNESVMGGSISDAITMQSADVTAPSVPASVFFTDYNVEGTNYYRLNWSASTDNVGVTGYKIYLDNVFQGSPGVINQLFYDIAVGTPPTGCWTVTAVDAAGNESTKPTCINYDVTAPSVPTSLSASVLLGTDIILTWTVSTDAGSGVSHYQLDRSTTSASGPWTSIDTNIGVGGFYDLETGLAPNTYWYRLRAVDNAGNISGWSNIATATIS